MPDTTPALVRRVLARYGDKAKPKRLKLQTWTDATGNRLEALTYDQGSEHNEHMEDADARHMLAGHWEDALGRWGDSTHTDTASAGGECTVGVWKYDLRRHGPVATGVGPDACAVRARMLLALPKGAQPFGRSET